MRNVIAALLLTLCRVAVAQDVNDDEMRDRYLVVVGSSDDFHVAKKRALVASHASGKPFYERGLVFDKKRGLIVPDDSPDETYAGDYVLRRSNEEPIGEGGPWSEFVSVERADAYELDHDEPTYIVVAGIYDSERDARHASEKVGGRVDKARIYMGCMH